MFIVLLGPPGAGKGTQAQRLAGAFSLVRVATGDLLREAVRRRVPLGITAKGYLDRGELVPDCIIADLVVERLDDVDAQHGVIFDGYPRTVEQARWLDRELARRGQRLTRVICLDVPSEVIIRRLGSRRICPRCDAVYNLLTNPPLKDGVCDNCGERLEHRYDDRPEVIRRRLDIYHSEDGPLTEYYSQRGLLTVVCGVHAPDAVGAAVLTAIPRSTVVPVAQVALTRPRLQ